MALDDKLAELGAKLSAVESPQVKLLRGIKRLIDYEFRDLTEDQRDRFSVSPVREIESVALAAFEKYNYSEIDRYLTDFQFALRRVLQHERQYGELKQHTPESEINDHRAALASRLYRAMELDAIHMLLKPGEKIGEIGWWTITTSKQTIRRDDLSKVNRPISFRDGNQWRRQFVSKDRVQEAIDAERKRQEPIHGQTVSPWVE